MGKAAQKIDTLAASKELSLEVAEKTKYCSGLMKRMPEKIVT
jgi:hypothetical protein